MVISILLSLLALVAAQTPDHRECHMMGGTAYECEKGLHIDNPKPPAYWTPEQWKNYRKLEFQNKDYGEFSQWHIYATGGVCTIRKEDDEGYEAGIIGYPSGFVGFVGNKTIWKDDPPKEKMPAVVRIAGTEAYHQVNVIPANREGWGKLLFNVNPRYADDLARGWLLQVYIIEGTDLIPITGFSLAGAGSAMHEFQTCVAEQKKAHA